MQLATLASIVDNNVVIAVVTIAIVSDVASVVTNAVVIADIIVDTTASITVVARIVIDGIVIGVVRDAIKLLPVASRDVQVLLHPDDAALVRDSLSAVEGERAWTIVEDPLISRGGCKITTENSQVDAQSEARLQAIIDAITGDERQK